MGKYTKICDFLRVYDSIMLIEASIANFINIDGQGHCLILSRALFSETLKFHLIRNQLKANFIWSLNKLKGMKVYTNELGHMTSMAVMPIYGKDL